jgi:hypothetical protein
VINVKESSLRAFKQNFRLLAHGIVQEHHGVGDKGLQILPGVVIGKNLFAKESGLGAERFEDGVVFLDADASFSSRRAGSIRSFTRKPTRAALSP